jgi:hypothetical protein
VRYVENKNKEGDLKWRIREEENKRRGNRGIKNHRGRG